MFLSPHSCWSNSNSNLNGNLDPCESTVIVFLSGSLERGNVSSLFPQGDMLAVKEKLSTSSNVSSKLNRVDVAGGGPLVSSPFCYEFDKSSMENRLKRED